MNAFLWNLCTAEKRARDTDTSDDKSENTYID